MSRLFLGEAMLEGEGAGQVFLCCPERQEGTDKKIKGDGGVSGLHLGDPGLARPYKPSQFVLGHFLVLTTLPEPVPEFGLEPDVGGLCFLEMASL